MLGGLVLTVSLLTRADLGDERVKAEYERGYKIALEFFDKWA